LRLTIVDDSTLFREGLVRVARDLGFEVVGQAGDAQSLVQLIMAAAPDVAVLDIRMPPTSQPRDSSQRERYARHSLHLACLSFLSTSTPTT